MSLPGQDPADGPEATRDERSRVVESQANAAEVGLVREYLQFLRTNKKWWLVPILSVMLLLMAIAAITMSPAAPFIYTLF